MFLGTVRRKWSVNAHKKAPVVRQGLSLELEFLKLSTRKSPSLSTRACSLFDAWQFPTLAW
ncbi:hypothetical protein LLS47_24365, partial [Rouxiella badensis]|uniref:hypothetical protein n=1 Tax=Rouxiella badensis TaxID=1646377 RepID=UPI001D14E86E